MNRDLFQILGAAFRDVFAAVPAPIAPEAHREACLRDACECCANAIEDVPAEAREACK